MAVRLGNVLWWFGLLLGGVVWTALFALAHTAGPIDEAVFWASLIAVNLSCVRPRVPNYRSFWEIELGENHPLVCLKTQFSF